MGANSTRAPDGATTLTTKDDADILAAAAWDKAYAEYLPIHERWDREYNAAEAMLGKERDAAFDTFCVNVVGYQAARNKFMAVPAPTLAALVSKMEIADHVDDEHYDLCLADAKRLAGGAA